jgi:hypothetical protein
MRHDDMRSQLDWIPIRPDTFVVKYDYSHMTMEHPVADNKVSKSEFKARALEYFRQVEASGECLVVTDYGKPTLEVRPYRNAEMNPLEILRGTVLHYVDPTIPIDVEWTAAE